MASATRDPDDLEGVEFVREDDGTITARDLKTGLARDGNTRAEALARLAEVLALDEGEAEPIDDPDEFLREEIGIEPNKVDAKALPDFLR